MSTTVKRTFYVCVAVETTASDEELMTAGRKTYEGHVEPGEEPIPGVEWAVVDIVVDTLKFEGTPVTLAGVDPAPSDECVQEGWWHPNAVRGIVHDHPARPDGNWSIPMHRLCQPVYTKRAQGQHPAFENPTVPRPRGNLWTPREWDRLVELRSRTRTDAEEAERVRLQEHVDVYYTGTPLGDR